MINDPSSASVYTDFQGLAELRAAAGQQTPESMRETARQFEALFVQTMLKAMRDASPGDGIFDSDKTDFYREMHDQQLALEMVRGRGLGIANMLMRSMGAPEPVAAAAQHALPSRPASMPPARPVPDTQAPLIDLNVPARPLIAQPENEAGVLVRLQPENPVQQAVAAPPVKDWRPVDPESFIRELLPVARRGAATLGVEPRVLVAQAALETGWGQKMIRHADGRNSFNLFGIKADSRWEGERATVSTLEYEAGVAQRQRAAFRAYGSLEESVTDYVDFLRSNPRYQQAIESAGDSVAFLQGLKKAGYATDPDYVEKIRSIMDGKSIDRGMDRLAYTDIESGDVTAGLW
ncbi:MAG: flagellar assembly peptidoglycan hydrolase FlgJ [Gammaproteobacteria bacterium]|nr:flagellar assembly peptidoglycan hydrolase FlgJ [Gammaproteobacteria bacterium]